MEVRDEQCWRFWAGVDRLTIFDIKGPGLMLGQDGVWAGFVFVFGLDLISRVRLYFGIKEPKDQLCTKLKLEGLCLPTFHTCFQGPNLPIKHNTRTKSI